MLIFAAFAHGHPIIASQEAVPFRLTPNMQHFITRVGIEGVITAAVTAIGTSLTMPEFDLGGTLSLFIRDEVSETPQRAKSQSVDLSKILIWHNTYVKEPRADTPLTSQVDKNVEHFIRRATMLGFIGDSKEKVRPPYHGAFRL